MSLYVVWCQGLDLLCPSEHLRCDRSGHLFFGLATLCGGGQQAESNDCRTASTCFRLPGLWAHLSIRGLSTDILELDEGPVFSQR